MDGKDNEHLKRVEALKRNLGWVSGGKEGRKLYESTTLQLDLL
jgi:hypothetical protein